ncbi:mechanosensitive ion channel family protein [Candidatus Woesearchaeota archaeon]|nr:mechanosensitive ion channel family protein [Candidatus Woesearchaeota archaeon]
MQLGETISALIQQQFNVLVPADFLNAAILFVGFLILARLAIFVNETYLLKIAKKTKTTVDDIILRKVEKPIAVLLVFIGFRLAIKYLPTVPQLVFDITETIIVLLIFGVIFSITRLFMGLLEKRWEENVTSAPLDEEVLPLVRSFANVVWIFIMITVLLSVWGVKIKPLLTSLGIAGGLVGLAASFALKDTLANVFGGMSLILDRTFSVHDFIELEDGKMGTIIDIGLRSTKIRTYENKVIIVPNGVLSNSQIINYAKPNNVIRQIAQIGVAYGSDLNKTTEAILDALKGLEGVLEHPKAEVHFIKMNEYSLDFRVLYYIEHYRNRWAMENKAMRAIHKSLLKNKIKIPFPTRTVYQYKGK